MLKKIALYIFFITLWSNISSQNKYYLSTSLGDDNNNGNINQPWKTLAKISNTSLGPGDIVYFKSGDTFKGHFEVNGSGTNEEPIVLTSYGSGEKPIISGSNHNDGGGDYKEAILVTNNDNIIFDNLEIQNHRTISRSGVGDLVSFGVLIEVNQSNNNLNNFLFRNMTFKNIYGLYWVDPSNQGAFNAFEVSGITFKSGTGGVINNVIIEDSYFTDLQRIGIHIKNIAGKTSTKRNKNFVVRNNEFFQTGGTCVLPIRTENCLIENNIFNQPGAKTNDKMIGRGSAVWNWYSINTIIQHNQSINAKGILDSHGIHVDHSNIDTFIQYNYMQDCEGGFVEILGGNQRAVYRFNISLNDGWRVNPNWTNSDHTIWLNDKIGGGESGHPSYDSYIYNNTIVINKSGNEAFDTAIDINGVNTRIFNNIFYAINGSGIGNQQGNYNDPNLMITNNLFFGNVRNNFKAKDSNKIEVNPNFYDEGRNDFYGFQINASSQAISNGQKYIGNYSHPAIPVEASSIFDNVEKYPSVDFFGNPLSADSNPNIGASNAKNGEITLTNIEMKRNKKIHVQNPMVYDKVILQGIDKSYRYSLVDLIGRVQQSGELKANQIEILLNQSLNSGIYVLKIENEYNSYSEKLLVH